MTVKRQVAAFSGGKDSTLMVLIERPKHIVYTPTGNELPGVEEHVRKIAAMVGAEVIRPPGPSLPYLIYSLRAVPNWRMRWCTRYIKILPVLAWARTNPDVEMLVGLRADEEERTGILTDLLTERFPLQERGITEADVWAALHDEGIDVPWRTDCAVCPLQGIHEWWDLSQQHPQEYRQGILWEDYAGHTLRSDKRDSWPAGLRELRAAFADRGEPKRYRKRASCRVCTL